MKKKTLLLIISMIAVVFCLSGCQQQTTKSKDVLNYGSTKDIRKLNPHLYGGEIAAQNIVFEGLVKNEDGKVKPALATSWEISKDGKTYTFHLRKGVKFSDGTKFDANVAKQNFDAVLANKERHAWLELVKEIDAVNVVNNDTLELKLKNPYYPTLIELGLPRPFAFVSPKAFINGQTKDGIKGDIGTGPYILKEYKKNKEAVFTVNQNYWGTKPKIKQINWKVIQNPQTLVMSLQKGDIDLIYGSDGDQVNIDTLKELQKDKNYKVYLSKPNASRSIMLNTSKPELQNLQVRKAIAMGINRKAIVQNILNGYESIAEEIFPKNTPYCDINLPVINYNQKQAEELLKQAGYQKNKKGYFEKDGKELILDFAYNNQNAQEGTIAEAIQADLQKIGIKVNILPEEKQAYLNRQQSGDFDLMYSLSWGAPYDPQSFVSSWRAKTGGHGDYQAQQGLAKKAWLDAEISKVLLSTNENERQAEYQEILNYITDQVVYVPISYSKTKAIANKSLQGVTFEESQYEIPFAKMSFK